MEPTWTKRIPSWAMCKWFYVFFVINVIVLMLLVSAIVYAFVSRTAFKMITVPNVFIALIQLTVASTNMLFFYLICDRSLHPT